MTTQWCMRRCPRDSGTVVPTASPPVGFAGVDTSFLVFQPDEATNIEFGVKGSSDTRDIRLLPTNRLGKRAVGRLPGALGIPGVVNGDEACSRPGT